VVPVFIQIRTNLDVSVIFGAVGGRFADLFPVVVVAVDG
jgi:hypothetical protein